MQRAWRLWFVVVVVLAGGHTLPQAWAQRDTLPSQLYYATLSDLYQGYWTSWATTRPRWKTLRPPCRSG